MSLYFEFYEVTVYFFKFLWTAWANAKYSHTTETTQTVKDSALPLVAHSDKAQYSTSFPNQCKYTGTASNIGNLIPFVSSVFEDLLF